MAEGQDSLLARAILPDWRGTVEFLQEGRRREEVEKRQRFLEAERARLLRDPSASGSSLHEERRRQDERPRQPRLQKGLYSGSRGLPHNGQASDLADILLGMAHSFALGIGDQFDRPARTPLQHFDPERPGTDMVDNRRACAQFQNPRTRRAFRLP